MNTDEKRRFKDEIYGQFARLGKALSSPRRLELVDLLAQDERAVDELAEETGMSTANTSRHLQVLRGVRLVRRRREGNRVYYRLASPEVYDAWRALRTLAEARLGDVREIVEEYLADRGELRAVDREELARRLEEGDVVVLDVRPEREYRAGHIPGARSLPLEALERRLDELPDDQEIVAYCRGPYCVFSDEAVRRLRARGYEVTRLEGGLPEWRAEGRPVEEGSPGSSAG